MYTQPDSTTVEGAASRTTTPLARKLTVREAAEHLRVSKSTLDKLRVFGGGPEYLKLGRRVIYNESDLETWAARGRRSNTSAAAA